MRQNARSLNQREHPKNHLRLPDLGYSKTAVVNNLPSVDGKRGYADAINEFVDCLSGEHSGWQTKDGSPPMSLKPEANGWTTTRRRLMRLLSHFCG
jgi:hypothetical protein